MRTVWKNRSIFIFVIIMVFIHFYMFYMKFEISVVIGGWFAEDVWDKVVIVTDGFVILENKQGLASREVEIVMFVDSYHVNRLFVCVVGRMCQIWNDRGK